MEKTFTEIKLFKVKPDKIEQFESFAKKMEKEQNKKNGCITIKYMKRFYTIDGIELGNTPRELTRIVKCVKYYSVWEFDNKINYGNAIAWFFDSYAKDLSKILIEPFDINIGNSL
ncbi:MAG TPA: hypothetical protein GX401_07275 [Clostridiales bacterium]|nr:hypothetical protein [Clostridiales bacterium]